MAIAPVVRLLRPGDWVKNLFVLPALVFSLPAALARGEPVGPMLLATALAVAAFCLAASGFYALNDVLDAPRDRLHPVKRRRPVASGAVTPGAAIAVGLASIAAAVVLSFLVSRALAATIVAYALLQVAYNGGIKRIMLVDVVALATGFALRATAGAVAIHVPMSIWLLLCVFFLTLYLGFIKRLCDLSSAAAAGDTAWRSPAGYDDRMELNWLLGTSAVLALVTYLMYALSDHAWTLFQSRALGFAVLSPLVLVSMHRFYHRANLGSSDSPLNALREDRVTLVAVGLFGVGVLLTLYAPPVQRALERVFMARPPAAATQGPP